MIRLVLPIANTLSIDSDTLDCHRTFVNLIFSSLFPVSTFTLPSQPSCVQLTIRHDSPEPTAQCHRRQPCYQKDDAPPCERGTMILDPHSDTVGDHAADDLSDAVETEPDVDARVLFVFGIPLS